MRSPLDLLLPLLTLGCVAGHASTISYTASGTFTSSTPSTPFAGPNETWAFAFQADSNPTIVASNPGQFMFAFSNFSYSLNGSPVAITPTFIKFGDNGAGGGWLVCFNGTGDPCHAGLSTFGGGPQMYTGTTSAPTLLTGAFTSTEFDVFVNTTVIFTQPNTTVQATLTPEPSTLLSLTAALVMLSVQRKALA